MKIDNKLLFCVRLICLLLTVSCASSKRSTVHKTPVSLGTKGLTSDFSGKNSHLVNTILKDAEKYLGTPYKFGGNTSSGFDCSGFTKRVFEENNYPLPRRSEAQSEMGKRINIREIRPGDLLFFATNGGRRVSHVGIVHSVEANGEIKFIHASTSRGVIISSLNQKYWNKAYLYARRVL